MKYKGSWAVIMLSGVDEPVDNADSQKPGYHNTCIIYKDKKKKQLAN